MLSVDGDVEALAEVVRAWLASNGRFGSPLLLAGESYGTTRGAALADKLLDLGLALDALILVSCAMDLQSIVFAPRNDLPYALFLPAFASVAQYHGRLAGSLASGLVSSVRGPGGGYRLHRPGTELSVAAIIDAVNENYDATGCQGKGGCQQGEICLTHTVWNDLSEQIHSFLSGITLAELVARGDVQRVSRRQDERDPRAARTRSTGDISVTALV